MPARSCPPEMQKGQSNASGREPATQSRAPAPVRTARDDSPGLPMQGNPEHSHGAPMPEHGTRAQRGSSSETPAPQDLKRVPTWVTTPDGWCWKAVRVELTKPHMQQHSGPSAALIRRRGEAALPRGAIEHGKYRRQERALGESQIRRVQRSRRSRREAASLCRQGRRRQVTRRQGRRPMEQRRELGGPQIRRILRPRRRREAASPWGAVEHGKYRRQDRALGDSQIRRIQRSRRSRREAARLWSAIKVGR